MHRDPFADFINIIGIIGSVAALVVAIALAVH